MSLRDRLISWLCLMLRPFFAHRVSHIAYGPSHSPSLIPHSPTSNLQPPTSILILKPCCLGDVLLATPVVAALRRAFPEARIDFGVGSWARPMVAGNPHLDGLLDTGPVGSGAYSLRDYLRLAQELRAGRYEICFVLDRSPLLSFLPFLAGVPNRVGLDSAGRGFSLTVPVPVSPKHEAELYLDTVRALGLKVERPRLEFYPSEEDRRRAEELLFVYPALPKCQAPVVVMHPGGGANPGMTISAKRWPPERFAALADRFLAEGAHVFLVGGPDDVEIAAWIKSAMPRSGTLRQAPADLTGRLSWGQLGALLECSDLFIGHDTGAMHLAVAAGVPVVALFGPSDPRLYGPYGGRSVALWHEVGCNPCFQKGRWNENCRLFKCIEAITVEEVWDKATALLENWG